ncbi:primary-amine oxidase [Streptoverticillium reticulum]|uniref:primary-amine oxidase n=1 Tax=Streptoverticillium reticulum TaxID=1433415 RepID=UPI0039BF7D95
MASASSAHPLDPLSKDEIGAVNGILRADGRIGDASRFVSITLKEPPKAVVQVFSDGPVPDREAFVVLREPRRRATYEAVVSLTRGSVTAWRHVPGAQPALTEAEFRACEETVRADARWQAALRRRGVTDFSLAVVDSWTVGCRGPADERRSRRLVHALTFVRTGPRDNPYARPVEGLRALVDLDEMTVLEVADEDGPPLPPHAGNYAADLIARDDNWTTVTAPGPALRPLDITQPEGPSFTVDGHAVSWWKWRLRLGFTPREGLVLHRVGFMDAGRERPVLYRASLSEIFTPYADPGLVHRHKAAFDEGEYGAGFVVNSLEPGCDCLGEIRYVDVVVHDDHGAPVTLPRAICLHEEDVGVGWKHTDFRTGEVETRRQRRLVVSSFAVLGNYQYGYFWYFCLDGTIEFQIKLTGMVSTGAAGPDAPPRCGTLLAPGLYAPNHQHFFNVRLDMCVDGNENAVHEVDAERLPQGEDNPEGGAWVARRTLLADEAAAQRLACPATGRFWLITNPAVRNRLGEPVAYKLVPGATALPQVRDDASAHRRAAFAFKHLWVTAYDPGQLFAAGAYPNQHPGDGLPAYAAADRPLDGTDLVVWHTFGDHHVVRPEDWPVMPVTTVGFQLKPFGFFDGNPALDVPPPRPHCSREHRRESRQ